MPDLGDLEHQIEAQMKAGRVPGLAVAAVRDGQIIYPGPRRRQRRNRLMVRPDTPFRIARSPSR